MENYRESGTRKYLYNTAKKNVVPSTVLVHSVADPDPGSGIRCLFDPWIWDIRDPGSGIGFSRIPDLGSRISDPGSRIPDLGSRIPRPYF
jgi:hypothetical protein